jgi:Peptidase family M1 domain
MPATGQTASRVSDAKALYGELLNPILTASDVHQVREVAIDREDLHIVISDGTIGLMRAVDGHITGAVFEGSGEILLVPPDRVERTSLALFTGAGTLEESFTSAYFRFFDDALVKEFQSHFREAEDVPEFLARWEQPIKSLAARDALQILRAMTNAQDPTSRFILARLGGTHLGVFDVRFDANAPEQISAGQERVASNQVAYYDIWTSFPMRSSRVSDDDRTARVPRFELSDYRMQVQAQPPTDVTVRAEVTLTPRRAGQRTVVLELSQYLRVSEVRADGQSAAFIQNAAISGSELARRGDDQVAVVFSSPLEKDHPVRLSMAYSGPVMFNAGGDLLYVGARGTWYPNVGPAYCNYDLTFEYPDDWTLVATGKQRTSSVQNGRRTTRFVSEKPLARAGFNLGKFETGSATAGEVAIHAHAAANVERELAGPEARAGHHPLPARAVRQIAEQAAASVRFLSSELDPFPYSDLEITQLPGLVSQSWPGLIYLSSTAFLDREERRAVGLRDPYVDLLMSRLMLAHETAHQWWGDAVDWVSYRDEWIIEALANYSALLMLEKEDPESMKTALEYYKGQLLHETPSGIVSEAGAVTLGVRLTSSRFPNAYERVLYGRGTWLFHMLRTMLRQASGQNNDALFFAALKKLLARSPSHKISTLDVQRAFEEVMPDSLTYEGHKSLDWFFDSWINGASIPKFTLADVRMAPPVSSSTKVTGTIEESHAAKDTVTAVPVYAVDESGKSRFLAFVFADETKTEFALTAPAGTKQILLDPEGMLLRR